MAQYGIQWNSNALNGKGQVQWMNCRLPYKILIKQNNNYHSIKSNLQYLGQPADSPQLKTWYEKYGVGDVNILTENLNHKNTPMTKDETTGIWKTDFQLDANDIVDNVQLVEDENNKSINYDCNEYRIIDLVNDEFEIKMLKG